MHCLLPGEWKTHSGQRARGCPNLAFAAQEVFLEEVVFKLNSKELIRMCLAKEQDVKVGRGMGRGMKVGRVS